MAQDRTPARIRWAVETLGPAPGDAVLEIGCGPGVGARLVLDRLGDGTLMALDRSAVAVRRTRQRNPEQVASGRLRVVHASLHDLDVPVGSLDLAWAIDVNLFWTRDPLRELSLLRDALRPGGRMLLAYGDSTGNAPRVRTQVARHLAGAGFDDVRPVEGAVAFAVQGVRA